MMASMQLGAGLGAVLRARLLLLRRGRGLSAGAAPPPPPPFGGGACNRAGAARGGGGHWDVGELEARLGRALGGRAGAVVRGRAVREQHATDESYHPHMDGVFPPDLVAFPRSTEEVARCVEVCTELRVALASTGALTSLEGHLAFLRGGVALSTAQMDAVLDVSVEDMECTVQAGVTRKQLNAHLRDTGLFFPVDPGADASLGGMASTRASGTNAVRYGTMRDVVKGVTAVLSGGRVVETGGAARKSSTGYDLTALLVGSEGTLGCLTEVRLRLAGQPEAVSSAVCGFEDLAGAIACVTELTQLGVPVARVELVDERQIAASNAYSGLELPERPHLFFEFHGSEAGVAEQAEAAKAAAAGHGGAAFRWSASAEERARLWDARHNAYYAALALRPGCKSMPTDLCLPVSKLGESIQHSQKLLEEYRLTAPLVGHVGDGNYHLLLLLDPEDREELERAKAFSAAIAEHALELGGTCSGEHGVGYGKLRFLESEHGAEALHAMHAIKQALDPHGLFNPGKLGSVEMFRDPSSVAG